MKNVLAISVLCALFCSLPVLHAENNGKMEESSSDVFQPISKYMSAGDAESLSAWFASNLEIMIFGKMNNASRNQALYIMKSFFDNNRPRSFNIIHKATDGNFKYAIGRLNAAGEHFSVTIFTSCQSDNGYKIQQLKIERMD